MKRLHTYLIWMGLLLAQVGQAQLSPGDLTNAHAEFEGISNCTQCHELGNKVTNAKCLDCHQEIDALMINKEGFHSSDEVVGKDCAKCHSEHHGREFDMVRFDEEAFDHNLTGYELEGQHKVIDCRDCHMPEYIEDPEIQQLENTFLGLSQECIACHDDYHQETLGTDCRSCHDIETFRPAALFDHNDTDYPLEGQHVEVECIKCHEITTRNELEFQVFADVPFNDCIQCHDDAHEGNLAGTCAQCHSVEGFSIFAGKTGFDHHSTGFPLNGEHQKTDCYACHTQTSDPLLVFQDQLGIGVNDCKQCHDDVHEGKFGDDCAKCHQETSFLDMRTMDFFDHDLTDYPLEGMHVEVDCKECHTTDHYSDPMAFGACMDCHEDFHEGQFTENGIQTDCKECHSLEEGFAFSLFTVEWHQEADFPLEGAHIATPCFTCHLDEEEVWDFRDIGTSCIDCHDNVHGNDFVVDGVTDCERCHTVDNWEPTLFDHDLTAFPLEGEHQTVECNECHKPEPKDPVTGRIRSFKLERFECIDCHQ